MGLRDFLPHLSMGLRPVNYHYIYLGCNLVFGKKNKAKKRKQNCDVCTSTKNVECLYESPSTFN